MWMRGCGGLRRSWYTSFNRPCFATRLPSGHAFASTDVTEEIRAQHGGRRDSRSRPSAGEPSGPEQEAKRCNDEVFLGRGFQMGGLSPLRYMKEKKKKKAVSSRIAEIMNRPEEIERREKEARERERSASGPITSFDQTLSSTSCARIKSALLVSAERCRLLDSVPLNERLPWYRELIQSYGYTMRNDTLLRIALVDDAGACVEAMSNHATKRSLNRLEFDGASVGVLRERTRADVVTNMQLAWLGDAVLSVLQRGSLLHELVTNLERDSKRIRKLSDSVINPLYSDSNLARLALFKWGVPRGHIRYGRKGSALEIQSETAENERKLGPAQKEAYGSLVEAVIGAVLLDSMQFGVAVEFARRAVDAPLQGKDLFRTSGELHSASTTSAVASPTDLE